MNQRAKKRVLWVENEPGVVELIDCLFNESGLALRLEIQHVADGDEAWEELKRSNPDLLVTDLEHPGLDGIELLKLLAAKNVKYPILILSGFDGAEERQRFCKFCEQEVPELEVNVMSKPFGNQELISYLTSAIAN